MHIPKSDEYPPPFWQNFSEGEVKTTENTTLTARIFSYLFALLTVYLLLWQAIEAHLTLPTYLYGRLIEVLGLLTFIVLALTAPLRFEEMGIVTSPACTLTSLGIAAALSAAFLAALAVGRLLTGAPLTFSWHIRGDISRFTYFMVAPLQEILAKSVLLYGLELALPRHPRAANLLAALTFAALHVVYGIGMMAAALALSLITGILFQKKRSVWGPALLHFVCGFFPLCLGF